MAFKPHMSIDRGGGMEPGGWRRFGDPCRLNREAGLPSVGASLSDRSAPDFFIAHMEVDPRFGDGVSNIDQWIIRPAIGYKLTDHWSVWQGYAWVGNYQPHLIMED